MASESMTEVRRAALRSLLVEQVDRTPQEAIRMRRQAVQRDREPGRLRAAVVTGVVAAVVVGGSVGTLQLSHLAGTSATGAGGVPAPPTAAVATSTPTPEPTGSLEPTTPPASTAPPAPTSSAAPTPDPTATPPAASGTALITPTGWRQITRDELHTFVVGWGTLQEDPSNASIWEQQAWLDIRCMADHGFVYDPIAQHGDQPSSGAGLTAQQVRDYRIAFWGPETDQPYDWRTAGCHGLSVHETGQDDAH